MCLKCWVFLTDKDHLNKSVSGVVHADLKLFLETNLPSGGKTKAVLGVADAKVGAALQEELNLSIQTGGVVAEIIRGKSSIQAIRQKSSLTTTDGYL